MKNRTHLKRAQLSGYQYKKRYHNPYFSNEKRILPWKYILIATLILFFISTVGALVLSHPIFEIRDVRVVGAKNTLRDDIEFQINSYLRLRRMLFFRNSNQFLFNEKKLHNQLLNELSLASVDINELGTAIEITIQERTSNLLWMTGGHTYVVDLEGIVVRESIGSIPGDPLPLFVDQNDIEVNIGSVVLTRDEIYSIFDFHKRIGELGVEFTQTKINRVAGKWMSLVTSDGYEIYFDASGDIQQQISILKTLFDQRIIDPSVVEYVDLRFGEQVYYK